MGESGLVTSAMEQNARMNDESEKATAPLSSCSAVGLDTLFCVILASQVVAIDHPNERLSPPRSVPRDRQHSGMSRPCRCARCPMGMPRATGVSLIL